MMQKELLTGVVGTSLSAVGTSLQTNEILQIISLVITIIGGIISFIVVPLLNWYKEAKKDGKIDEEELKDGINIVVNGSKDVKEKLDENQDKKKGQ